MKGVIGLVILLTIGAFYVVVPEKHFKPYYLCME